MANPHEEAELRRRIEEREKRGYLGFGVSDDQHPTTHPDLTIKEEIEEREKRGYCLTI